MGAVRGSIRGVSIYIRAIYGVAYVIGYAVFFFTCARFEGGLK